MLGLGVGMVFVPVSVTSMAGIPASHAGVASGFLMTGHEIGAALGVAILSAVASSAGSLATATGAADAFSAGFIGAAVIGTLFAVFAMLRMPATKVSGGGETCTCTDMATVDVPHPSGPGEGRRARARLQGQEQVLRWSRRSVAAAHCWEHKTVPPPGIGRVGDVGMCAAGPVRAGLAL